MTNQLRAYLALERIGIECDRDGDDFGDFVRDHIDIWWNALSDEERAWLRARRGATHDDINKIRVVETVPAPEANR